MINFILQTPSLQRLAAVKTVAALWNHPDILKRIAEISDIVLEQAAMKWDEIEEKVKVKALVLELKEPCKQQVINFIYSLGMEIFTWYKYYYNTDQKDELIVLKCSLPKHFCWTMHGVIDNAKTAQLMVKDESLDVVRRYEMACVNCLEDEARQLIQFIPEDRRREYMNRVINVNRIGYNHFLVFFTCSLSGDVDQLNVCFQPILSQGVSINRYLFYRSSVSYNQAKSEYFFTKLNQEERKFVLGKTASNYVSFPVSTVLFYFPLMNEEQQRRMFRECIGNVLLCLLNWPRQSLFMEAAECGRRYMVYGDFEKVLCAIASKISAGARDYDYSQLFWECWRLTPADVQQSLFDNVSFLDKLLETGQEEIIDLLWKEAPAHQILALFNRNDKSRHMLLDESVISDAALMKYKESAALVSSNDPEDEEKRLRSQQLSQLIDIAMECRQKKRRLV